MLNVIEIKDFNAPELDIYARCTEARLLNKDHPEEGMFIAESPKVIGRALDAGYEPLSVLVEKKQMEENEETSQIMNRFDDTKVSIFTADFEVLTKLTGFKLTRGMLCAMRRKPLRKFQDLCDGINRIAILENVQNPTNVGAIFRSAAALNMGAIFLSPGCSDPLYRRASRVSMGTVFQIPWTFIRDSNEMRCKREVIWPKQAIAELKKLGYKTAALALTDDSVSIDDSELMKEEKLAVILGNEGEGLESETIALCDYTVKIPMTHGVDSLNVAAASAVAFWQLGKIIL
jgi:tRNA G18 (ribose-2'-O)-methylase SpoU